MRASRTGRALLALLSLVCLGAAAGAPAQAEAAIKLGVHTPGAPGDARALDDFAALVGRKPEIINLYRDVTAPLLHSNEISNLAARGQTPMVTWEPFDASGRAIPMGRIADGSYDAEIRSAARLARAVGREILIRFAHEMNLLSSPWGPGKDGNDGPTFIRAWQRVVSLFRQEGAANVRWVWSPNVDYGGRPFTAFFPGDNWVDYVGLDGYNWGTGSPGEEWTSMAGVFVPSYRTITQLSTKPVILAETASSESGGSKAAWIRDGFLTAIPQQMPKVYAVVWFNRVQEDDWRVNSSASSLDAYRAVVASSLYGGSLPPPGAGNPVLRAVRVTRRLSATRVRGRLKYRLSERASVRIVIERRSPNGEWRARFVNRRVSRGGLTSVPLARVVRRHRLGPGAYRAIVRALDRDGNRSHPRRVGFRVLSTRR
jgi:hypothetical protein